MKQDNFPKTVRGFYWLIIKKFPWYFGSIFTIGVFGMVIDMIFGPLVTKWVTQIFENAASSDWVAITRIFMYIIAMFVFTLFLNMSRSILQGLKQQIFNRYKLYVLYKRVYDNDISFFIDTPAGQIISQTQVVSGRLNELMEKFYSRIIGTVLGFLFLAVSMVSMNVWFLILLLGYGVIKLVWEWTIQRKITKNSEQEMQEGSIYSGLRSDSLNNALTVKYFSNTEYENKYIYNGRANLIKIIRHGHFLDRCQWVPTHILWRITQIGMIFFCFVLVKNGELNISNAIFVMTSIQTINSSFNRLNEVLRQYTVSLARAKKAYANIIVDKKVVDKENAKKLSIKDAEISFQNINFSYGKNTVFKHFNLVISKGEKVGIVGLSGAGKTTICNLLLRMYDVQDGKILINDTDIRDVTQESLRKNISYVPQETTLFNRTIMENIRYAKPHSTRAEIIEAAKKANIHEFISRLPKGYDTLVGNNGIKLSGGQRQRVSIARALLKNAPILILDEATSALDSQNEMMIQKSLQSAMAGKTTLVIAHRLSTLKNMDRIVVIKNGKIVETGTHNQLVHKNGEYSKLWHIQTHKK